VTDARSSFVLSASFPTPADAPPLAYRDVDLLGRPDAPDRRFSLTVTPATVVAVLGDEDSGVDALGGLALGLAAPASGSVQVFGLPIASLPYSDLLLFRRRVGYLPLGDGLLQNLSLRDNVALPVRFATRHRVREVDARVNRLIDDFGLKEIAELRPAEASEEDRRRTAAARAVALDPALAVLDFPFTGMSRRASAELLERVSRRADGSQRAVLLTARELSLALRGQVTSAIRVADGVAAPERVSVPG
jgi:ABC-type transporter Mla maintaining outer membrane lipid asymmetry ATPase subunit MlaF